MWPELIDREYSGRIAILLRQALDANAKVADRIKSDPCCSLRRCSAPPC